MFKFLYWFFLPVFLSRCYFGFLPAIATVASAWLGKKGQDDTNEANAAQSAAQMDFQERMSNTAHQREVADLKAAGLNPMLSAKLGGSSTPPGASAVMQNSNAAGINSALAAANVANVKAQTEKVEADTMVSKAQVGQIVADMEQKTSSAKNLDIQTKQIDSVLSKDLPAKKMAEEIRNIIQNTYKAGAEEHLTRQKVDTEKAETMLRSLDIPKAQNLSEAQKSYFMKEIAPYWEYGISGINSATKLKNIGGDDRRIPYRK